MMNKEMGFSIEGVKYVSEFNSDVICFDNGNFFWLFVNVEEVIVVYVVFSIGDCWRNVWFVVNSD